MGFRNENNIPEFFLRAIEQSLEKDIVELFEKKKAEMIEAFEKEKGAMVTKAALSVRKFLNARTLGETIEITIHNPDAKRN